MQTYTLEKEDVEFIMSEVVQALIGQMAVLGSEGNENNFERINNSILSLTYFHADFLGQALETKEFSEVLAKNAARLLTGKRMSLVKILENVSELDKRELFAQNLEEMDKVLAKLPKVETQLEERKRIIIP